MSNKDIGSYSFEETKQYIEDCGYVFYDMGYKEYGKNKDKRMCVEVSCGSHDSYWVMLSKFKNGQRCRKCNTKKITKWNEQTIKDYINNNNYKFIKIIGKEIGNNTRVLIECDSQHEYETKFANFYSGKRCPYCYGNVKHTYGYIKNEIEKSNEYKLLSNVYENNLTRLQVKCLEHDYIYETTWANWQSGSRCKLCANDKLSEERRHSIEYIKEQIEKDGDFTLISDYYINNNTLLQIQCNNCNNVFQNTFVNITNSKNCPYCKSVDWNLYEKETLLGMLRYYKECFSKVPNEGDVDEANYMPSASVYYRIFEINNNNWNEILKLANLYYDKKPIYTDDILRKEFFRWINQHDGRIPKRGDMKHRDGYPNSSDYCIFYGVGERQWKPILDIMGVKRLQTKGKRRAYKYDNLNKDDVIELLKSIYKTEGNVNQDVVSEYISAKYVLNILNVQKWNDVLNICKLGKTKEREYDTDKELKILKQRIISLGYVPTQPQYIKLGYLPSISWFSRHFGSYGNALNGIGYKTFGMMNNEDLKRVLVEYTTKLGRQPTSNDMGRKNNMPGQGLYYSRFNTTKWSEVLEICGIEHDIVSRYSKKHLINKIIEFSGYLNRIPTRKDFKDWNWRPTESAYYDRFGTMEQAYLEAGLIDEILTEDDRVSRAMEVIQNYYSKYGYPPTTDEYDINRGSAYNRHTLERILNKRYSEIVYDCLECQLNNCDEINKTRYDKLGNLCNSQIEVNISNYFIEKGVKFEKEVSYSEIIRKEIRYPRRFDWKIQHNGKFYYVEYFGLYDVNSNWDTAIKYVKRTRKKIKDLYKAGAIDNCIFLFPNDLKNKTLDEIFGKFINTDKLKQLNVS